MQLLNKIQKELKAPKGQFNSFGKYKYRSCEDILEAVKPLLGDATLVINDEIVNIGNRYYVRATATLKSGEESESATAYARESEDKKGMDDAQITGATSSYARKYALNGLFLIDDTQDADTQDNTAKVQKVVTTALPEKERQTPMEKAKDAIKNAIDKEELAKLAKQIDASTKLNDAEKEILQKEIINESSAME